MPEHIFLSVNEILALELAAEHGGSAADFGDSFVGQVAQLDLPSNVIGHLFNDPGVLDSVLKLNTPIDIPSTISNFQPLQTDPDESGLFFDNPFAGGIPTGGMTGGDFSTGGITGAGVLASPLLDHRGRRDQHTDLFIETNNQDFPLDTFSDPFKIGGGGIAFNNTAQLQSGGLTMPGQPLTRLKVILEGMIRAMGASRRATGIGAGRGSMSRIVNAAGGNANVVTGLNYYGIPSGDEDSLNSIILEAIESGTVEDNRSRRQGSDVGPIGFLGATFDQSGDVLHCWVTERKPMSSSQVRQRQFRNNTYARPARAPRRNAGSRRGR